MSYAWNKVSEDAHCLGNMGTLWAEEVDVIINIQCRRHPHGGLFGNCCDTATHGRPFTFYHLILVRTAIVDGIGLGSGPTKHTTRRDVMTTEDRTIASADLVIEANIKTYVSEIINLFGRPKRTWRRSILDETGRSGKSWEELKKLARDRDKWRAFTEALCSTRN
ncbi:hypothetical protein Btru_038565 [Bulinus truncatus]|nr:hypothetical protein Btru_038565 [Bulinus truncatus]